MTKDNQQQDNQNLEKIKVNTEINRLADHLKSPLISEKAVILAEKNKYVFIVSRKANKPEIKKAIESIFKVKVDKVNVLNWKGKPRIVKGIQGRVKGFKKAIVSLKEGEKINIIPK